MKPQRGGFVLGLVVGLLVGLALALGVALYITKTPVPFINKVPQHGAGDDSAELERNRNWDPNAPLASKLAVPLAGAASGVVTSASAPTAPVAGPVPTPVSPGGAAGPIVAPPANRAPPAPPGTQPGNVAVALPRPSTAGQAMTNAPPGGAASAPDPFIYFVQAGAYTSSDDAEQQRARLGLLGQEARVTPREQAGRTVYRVRMGPFETPVEANAVQSRLLGESVDARIVRVERQ